MPGIEHRALFARAFTCAAVVTTVLLVGAIPASASGTDVTFTVDMSLEAAWGALDPASDVVAVRGNHSALGNWSGAGAALVREGATMVYSGRVRFEDLQPGEGVEYKFVVNEAGDPASVIWEESIANRTFAASGEEPDDFPPPDGDGYAELALPSTYFDHDEAWEPEDRLIGADLSFLPRLLSLGAVYRVDGLQVQPLEAFREHGYGTVRLRLWHTPDEPWHGLDATVAHAVDAAEAGHEIMLDFHYSDTWADPGHQEKPAAWVGLPFSALVDSVYAYTNAAMVRFRDEGVIPSYVQLGNEISQGMLWDDGRVGGAWDTPEQWSNLGALLDAGVAAVRDSIPEAQWPGIVVHVDNGGSNGLCRWFFDNLADEGVSFDAIGVSFYPWWHGTLWNLRDNLRDLANVYGKELLVVETAYPWTLEGNDETGNFVDSADDLHPGYDATPAGQAAFLRDLLAIVEGAPGALGRGVIYWEPGYLTVPGGPGNPYENLTLFDFDGDALPGLGFALPWETSTPGGGEDHGSLPLLAPCSPNPFGATTRMELAVPCGGANVGVHVYDVSGRRVATLAEGFRRGGVHCLRWSGDADDGEGAAAGVYFCRAIVGERTDTAKIVHVR
ncbi:MAG: hypothetical protein GF400_01195 [Candidatus Eisenbacteria bacterium]|nr:hypothetical protein [Candidatus Eisenbacteria bacterium]